MDAVFVSTRSRLYIETLHGALSTSSDHFLVPSDVHLKLCNECTTIDHCYFIIHAAILSSCNSNFFQFELLKDVYDILSTDICLILVLSGVTVFHDRIDLLSIP